MWNYYLQQMFLVTVVLVQPCMNLEVESSVSYQGNRTAQVDCKWNTLESPNYILILNEDFRPFFKCRIGQPSVCNRGDAATDRHNVSLPMNGSTTMTITDLECDDQGDKITCRLYKTSETSRKFHYNVSITSIHFEEHEPSLCDIPTTESYNTTGSPVTVSSTVNTSMYPSTSSNSLNTEEATVNTSMYPSTSSNSLSTEEATVNTSIYPSTSSNSLSTDKGFLNLPYTLIAFLLLMITVSLGVVILILCKQIKGTMLKWKKTKKPILLP